MPEEPDEITPEVFTSALSAAACRLRAIITRELAQRPEAYTEVLAAEPSVSPAITAITALVDAIATGRDISQHRALVTRLTHEHAARAEVLGALMQVAEYDRYIKLAKARQKTEDLIAEIATRGELSPTEALAILEYTNAQTDKIVSRTNAAAMPGGNLGLLLDKLTTFVTSRTRATEARVANTTPQHREIMRRLATTLLKAADPKVGSNKSPG